MGRRYREFEDLRNSLQGLLQLPPMPPKSVFLRKTFSTTFNMQRQEALDLLLRTAVSADPSLTHYPSLRNFLGVGQTHIPMNGYFAQSPFMQTPVLPANYT